MDRFGEWRPIEPAADDVGDKPSPTNPPAKPAEPAKPEANANNVRLVGLLCAGVLAVAGVMIWFLAPGGGSGLDMNGSGVAFAAETAAPGSTGVASGTLDEVVVDIEGAVVEPGVHRLPPGSRVGDAIAAAGGYSLQVDIAAASAVLNLAESVADGAKIHVPARGEADVMASTIPRVPSAVGPGPVSGLINVNSATSEQLDTLPGIGPVTAAKIIAARESAPFASLDELVSRKVLGASTLEKIKTLITVGP